MPRALILSSFVAAEPIGGGAQAVEMGRRGITPVLAPTVLAGRSPAKGSVVQAVDDAQFARMLADARAEGIEHAGLVITGYFASPGQVEMARRAIGLIPNALVVVDPVMGDHPGGLYVKPEVAEAVQARLAPMAHYLTPNMWELERLSPGPLADAARRLGRPVLATSVEAGEGRIGLACVEQASATLFAHRRLDEIPHGIGDLVTAVFAARLHAGDAPRAAAKAAARAVAIRLQVAVPKEEVL